MVSLSLYVSVVQSYFIDILSYLLLTIHFVHFIFTTDCCTVCRYYLTKYGELFDTIHCSFSVMIMPWAFAKCVKLRVVHAHGILGAFPRHRRLAIETCIMARAWPTCCDACQDRLLAFFFEVGGGESVAGACATLNFTNLVRGALESRLLCCHCLLILLMNRSDVIYPSWPFTNRVH